MSQFNDKVLNFSISKEVYEIGSKQIIIDQLRKFKDVYMELLVKVKSKKYMIDLYLDASKQVFNLESEEIFKKYEKLQIDWQERFDKDRKILEKKIEFLDTNINRIKNELSINESKWILDDSKKQFEKWSSTVNEHLIEIKPMFIKEYVTQNSKQDTSEFAKASNRFSKSVKIMVLGKRGAGKSSFINSIRNMDIYDEDNKNIAKTSEVECTELCHFYKYDFDPEVVSNNNKETNFYLIDVPGVGTNKFPSNEYTNMLLNLEPDVFVYLYQSHLEEIDYKIISDIKSKRNGEKVFLVKNKIDLDFEEWLQSMNTNKLDIESLSEEQMEFMIKEHWPAFNQKLDNCFTSFLAHNKLDLHEKCYFISSNSFYRPFFDFDMLICDLLNYLPPEKSNRFKDVLRYVFNKTYLSSLFKKSTI